MNDSEEDWPTALDLFSGCGGLTAGLREAGFLVVAAIEQDPNAAASYRANHPEVSLYELDIRTLTGAQLRRDLQKQGIKRLDLLAGCPPCQGFTRLTERRSPRDPRNQLIREYLRIVKALRPRTCVMENVPGLLGRGLFTELLRGLRKLDYKVRYQIVQLADYGVPQRRRRLVLVAGHKLDVTVPTATHSQAGEGGLRPWRTVRDAIEFLPVPPKRSAVLKRGVKPKYKWHFARDSSATVRSRLSNSIKNGIGRDLLPKALRLKCHEGLSGFHDVYGTMRWNQPSPTITGGCTNASKGRFGHPATPRPLTPLEAALLQTFKVKYRFVGTVESVAEQIGNALPRRFSRLVARHVKRALAPGHQRRRARRDAAKIPA